MMVVWNGGQHKDSGNNIITNYSQFISAINKHMADKISQTPQDADEIVVHECELTELAQKRIKPGPKGGTWTTATYDGIIVGRDKVVIPPEQVYELAKIGLKSSEIARFFGVKIESINRHFASEIEKGYEMMKISLRRAMLNNAVSNNNAAVQIFLAKNWLSMSDNPVNTDDAKILPWNDDLENKDQEIRDDTNTSDIEQGR